MNPLRPLQSKSSLLSYSVAYLLCILFTKFNTQPHGVHKNPWDPCSKVSAHSTDRQLRTDLMHSEPILLMVLHPRPGIFTLIGNFPNSPRSIVPPRRAFSKFNLHPRWFKYGRIVKFTYPLLTYRGVRVHSPGSLCVRMQRRFHPRRAPGGGVGAGVALNRLEDSRIMEFGDLFYSTPVNATNWSSSELDLSNLRGIHGLAGKMHLMNNLSDPDFRKISRAHKIQIQVRRRMRINGGNWKWRIEWVCLFVCSLNCTNLFCSVSFDRSFHKCMHAFWGMFSFYHWCKAF